MAYFEHLTRIVVLGGGPGGYSAALAGAQLGAEVTVVERASIGGAAVLTDVVPSKSLIATAASAVAVRESAALGVRISGRTDPEVSVDLAAVNRRLISLAQDQSDDIREQLETAGVRLVFGDGRLDGPQRIRVNRADGDQVTIEADTVIVATGARPRELPSARPDGERILTWQQLYDLDEIPEHLIVVGSGVTGAEFASAYRAIGAEVTLVSSRDRVLPGEDADAAAVIEEVFTRDGMTVLSRSRAERVERDGDSVVVTLTDGRRVVGSHCLMAVGSIPNTEGIGLAEAGVQLTESGHIRVNRVARTSVSSIYAAGDCSDFLPLASVAGMQGRTAVFHALGDISVPTELRNVTSNIFTTPEVATVGWSQKQIEDGLVQGMIVKLDLQANPRAKMQGLRDGFVKLFARTGSGTVIGGVVVAPTASDLILPIALAVQRRLTVDQMARTFSVYPSLSETVTNAARALHVVDKGDRPADS